MPKKLMTVGYSLGILAISALVATALGGCGGPATIAPDVEPSPPVHASVQPSVGSPESPPVSPPVSPIETPATFQSPIATPASPCATGCFEPSERCVIKGVVTGMGDKYYYLPEMEGYREGLLLVKYGGRWFCTEEEAIQNGFEKAP